MVIRKGAFKEAAEFISSSYVYYENKKTYNEEYICFRIYEMYYKHNKEIIWSSEDDNKIQRFYDISEKRKNQLENDEVFELYEDILYIEIGFEKAEKKQTLESIDILFDVLKYYGYENKPKKKELIKKTKEFFKNQKKGKRFKGAKN